MGLEGFRGTLEDERILHVKALQLKTCELRFVRGACFAPILLGKAGSWVFSSALGGDESAVPRTENHGFGLRTIEKLISGLFDELGLCSCGPEEFSLERF